MVRFKNVVELQAPFSISLIIMQWIQWLDKWIWVRLERVRFFFLEYAGELRIIVLIEERERERERVLHRPKTHTHTPNILGG